MPTRRYAKVVLAPPHLDLPVGGGEQRRRDRDAERLGGLQVDDQLEFGRLHPQDENAPAPTIQTGRIICAATEAMVTE